MKYKEDDLQQIYLSLKRRFYYENNVLLYFKKQIADFEYNNNFLDPVERKKFFKNFCEKLNKKDDIYIDELISKVKYKKVLKIKKIDNSSKKYKKDYNYIIDCPIELHLISLLWIIELGHKLDEKIGKYSYGYRIDRYEDNNEIKKHTIFKKYIDQYQSWKKNGIDKIRSIVEEEENVILIELDLQRFYYNIDCDKLKEKIKIVYPKILEHYLTKAIFKIIEHYGNCLSEVDEFKDKNNTILPIGLYSSAILANIYLKDVDEEILKTCPAYYGRYVDDMIIVFKEYKTTKLATDGYKYLKSKMTDFLMKTVSLGIGISLSDKVLKESKKEKITFFNGEDSKIKILELESEFAERASTFVFLPNETEVQKIYRKITGEHEEEVKNKKYDVSVYLSKILAIFIGADKQVNLKRYANDLLDFLYTDNLLKYSAYYEKIFTILLAGDLIKELEMLYKKTIALFKRDVEIREYVDMSLSFALSLRPCLLSEFEFCKNKKENENKKSDFERDIKKIIASNMLQNKLITYPLLNYLDFGNKEIIKIDFIKNRYFDFLIEENGKYDLKLNKDKITLSPRFIHLDEFNIFYIKKYMLNFQGDNLNYLEKSEEEFKNNFHCSAKVKDEILGDVLKKNENAGKLNFYKVDNIDERMLNSLRIGIASLRIKPESLRFEEKSDLSLLKKQRIIEMLNLAKKNKVNILVFPELSIPFQWIKIINEFSRKNKILVTGGLEHIHCPGIKYDDNNLKYVFNYLFTTLPFSTDYYHTSFIKVRLKNYYSPYEREVIEGKRFVVPENEEKEYDIFSWKGIYFSNFNCFELSDIDGRSKLKNYIDLLIASVFNKDIKYFQNILESTCRDLHVYIAQSNTSVYGDCEIIQPTKKDTMIIGLIKGGINDSLLVGDINIAKLRKFQLLKNELQDSNMFKLTPPGIDPNIVKARIENKLEDYLKKDK